MTDSDEITVETVHADRRTGSPALRTAPSAASQVGAALLALLAVGGWWLGLLIGAYVFEVFDFRLGRIAGLGAAGGGVLVALLNVPLTKRLPTAASVVIALAGGLLFTSIAVPLVPPGYYAMRAELHRLDPPEWKVLDDEIARRGDEDELIGDLAAWYQEVALGLADGSITLNKSGNIKGAPSKPSAKGGRGRMAGSRHYDYEDPQFWDMDHIERTKEAYQKQKNAVVKELQNSIDMISMSVSETVQVDAADYNAMLTGDVMRRGYYY